MSEPGVIKKLDETVVNRIAAGEVIQRPANAVKELLENSLDAGSTNINITVKGGGLKFLQIHDNGCGIRKEDLGIVAERFTTSKLRDYEDLTNISTFGFRGEALASISHVAHLTIITKTHHDKCAYKASYLDGKPTGAPKPVAGNQGTQIIVEDLFYNIATRRKAFKSPGEEHSKILDVVSKYAIHNPSVGFTVKKQGEHLTDLCTSPNSSHSDNIRIIYGQNIARELLTVENQDEVFKCKLFGLISNVNYSTKKLVLILFINHRLVNSSGLRAAIETVYSSYLPKGSYPFVYLSLEMEPRNVDVNVHPTKHEVHFLHEESIIENTKQVIESKLLGSNTSRVFYTQAKLPTVNLELEESVMKQSIGQPGAPTVVSQKSIVRMDATVQKIDKFLVQNKVEDDTSSKSEPDTTPTVNPQRREIKLTSVLSLRKDIEDDANIVLRDLVSNMVWVGAIDPCKILVQHDVTLYLIQSRKLLEQLFYQILLYDFGNLGEIKFKEGLPLKQVLLLGLDDPLVGWTEDDGPKESLAEAAQELLISKSPMLLDYFSLELSPEGLLQGIPLLVDNYTSMDMSRLPWYLLKLATHVDWSAEKSCFQTIARVTAQFYSYLSCHEEDSSTNRPWQWTLEHVLFPVIKAQLLPPSSFSQDQTILEVANLPNLYKVFERC